MGEPCVIENVCFVGSDKPVDIAVGHGRIASVRPSERTTDTASKIWVIPGLWDCHTHFTQWSYTLGRLDLIDARSASEALDMLRRHLEERRESGALDPNQYVVGMRFRHSLWSDDAQPTLAAIDAVAGDQPVALSSADMHCGWVNSAAARKLGVDVDESGLVGELEWFDAYCKLDKGPGAANELMHLLRNAERDAASKGVVGVRDYEMAENIDTWISRFSQGLDGLRVEAGIYPERLRQAIDDGWHTGDELPGSHGLGHVVEHGFDIACHAIGDEANTIVLDCAERTHAHGSIEHAQMLKERDIPRLAQLGLAASIQPQHAMDDRDVIARFWGTPAGIPYAFNSLHKAGTKLLMGSDAPVAPLDPWMAISAAVFGTESSDREPFQPEQCLDFETALASSTAVGRVALRDADAADLVLLDCDPSIIDSPEAMRAMPEHVLGTMLAGRWTYQQAE